MPELVKITDLYTKAPMARAIPDAWFDREQRAWVLDAESISARSAAVALKLFPELALASERLVEARDSLIQDVRPFDNATEFGRRIDEFAPTVTTRLTEEGKSWFEFQTLDLGYMDAVLSEHGSGYIGWERGMGKTIGTCALVESRSCHSVLSVVPNTAKKPVWLPELLNYIGDLFDQIIVLPNGKRDREYTMAKVKAHKEAGESIFLIVHYESLAIIAKTKPRNRGWDQYGEWDLVVGDEIHRVKNLKAQMTRALKKVPTKLKLGLSGSIIENHLEELFSVLQWLYPERYRSKWRDWNDRFLDYVEGGYSKVFVGVLPDMVDELRSEIGVFLVYRRKDDELDMPERLDEDRFVDLSPGQRKAYDELVAACVAKLDSGESVAAEDGLPMLTKLRQIATGLDLVGDVNDSTKLDLAAEIIEDNPEEYFVVFSWFKAACTALAERLGEQALVITGDVIQDRRDDIIEEFKDDTNSKRVLVATIKTMGESQNFQIANNVIFLDRSWNPMDNTQAEDRVYRIGQEKKVTITNIIAKDTADELRVSPTLANKDSLRRMVLGG